LKCINSNQPTWDEYIFNACRYEYLDVIELLVSKYNKNLNYNQGLYGACYGGKMKSFVIMINKGANNFYNAFFYACTANRMNMVKLIINNNEIESVHGLYISCHCACKTGKLNILQYVLDNYSNIDNLTKTIILN